ncbi:right-handed parallel beta-helix repeat-containing protein [Calidifontibacillus erzurumensis]|uniref:right-handed parallel beta-helix repeat-containing protein n=1 Tax=Calidifontibacillus erzurumensis TaxID=2741433 RepID=UPI0035B52784
MKTFFLFLISLFFLNGIGHAEEMTVSNEKELQMALENLSDHDVIVMKEGIYKGTLTIDKSITIKGETGATLVGPNQGNVITINADDVTIENLQIEGSGSQNAGIHVNGNRSVIKNNKLYNVFHGIVLKNSYGHQIEGNVITSFQDEKFHKGHGVYLIEAPQTIVSNNYIYQSNDGIYLSYSNLCLLTGNQIIKTRYGIHLMDSEDVGITQNQLINNRNGLMIMQSLRLTIKENLLYENKTLEGAGLFLFDTFDSTISANIFKKNNKGIYFENGKRNEISFNEFIENDKGIELGKTSENNQIYLNNFFNNIQQVITDQDNVNSFNRDGYGNYWDDQTHIDLGLGNDSLNGTSEPEDRFLIETVAYAYKSGDVFYHLTADEPYLQIFSGSPAVRLWNAIEQFTAIPSKQFIIDEHPLQEPIVIERSQILEGNGSMHEEMDFVDGCLFAGFLSISFFTLWKLRRTKHESA